MEEWSCVWFSHHITACVYACRSKMRASTAVEYLNTKYFPEISVLRTGGTELIFPRELTGKSFTFKLGTSNVNEFIGLLYKNINTNTYSTAVVHLLLHQSATGTAVYTPGPIVVITAVLPVHTLPSTVYLRRDSRDSALLVIKSNRRETASVWYLNKIA